MDKQEKKERELIATYVSLHIMGFFLIYIGIILPTARLVSNLEETTLAQVMRIIYLLLTFLVAAVLAGRVNHYSYYLVAALVLVGGTLSEIISFFYYEQSIFYRLLLNFVVALILIGYGLILQSLEKKMDSIPSASVILLEIENKLGGRVR